MRIFLIGMPGSGKTTIGRKLSEHLSWIFLDTDEMIETQTGQTISEIFSSKGEDYFRTLEHEIVSRIQKDTVIIATGGGTPIYHDNLSIMKSLGVTIFLKTSPQQIKDRLKGSTNRPLVEANLDSAIDDLYKKRLPIYEQANIILDAEDPELLNKLLEIVKN